MSVDIDGKKAAALLTFAQSLSDWVVRRTVTVTFDGATTYCYRTECQVSLNSEAVEDIPIVYGRVALPIATFSRDIHRPVSIICNGDAIPTLLREDERLIIATGLVYTIYESKTEFDLNVNVQALIESVAAFLDGNHQADSEWQSGELFARVRRYADKQILIGLPEASAVLPSDSNTDYLSYITTELTEKIPVRERTTHLLYEAARVLIAWPARKLNLLQRNKLQYIQNRFGRRYFNKWGVSWWVPDIYVMELQINDLLESASYHLHLQAPNGLHIRNARLNIYDDKTEQCLLSLKDQDPNLSQAHMYFNRGMLSPANQGTNLYGKLLIALQPTFHDGLRTAQNMSLAAWAAQVIVTLDVVWPSLKFLPQINYFDVGQYDLASLVAFLLVGPLVVIAAVLRQDEHPLTKKVMSGARARVVGTAILLFADALCLTIDMRGWALDTVFIVGTGLTTLFASLTLIAANDAIKADPEEWAHLLRTPLLKILKWPFVQTKEWVDNRVVRVAIWRRKRALNKAAVVAQTETPTTNPESQDQEQIIKSTQLDLAQVEAEMASSIEEDDPPLIDQ